MEDCNHTTKTLDKDIKTDEKLVLDQLRGKWRWLEHVSSHDGT